VTAPDIEAWQAWDPRGIATVLSGVDVPWYVAGGWAVDLWLGRISRPHEDLEIAVPRRLYQPVRARLRDRGLDLYEAHSGEVTPLPDGVEPREEVRQIWCCADGAWRTDVMLEQGDGETWISHRDPRVAMPLTDVIAYADGIPYLRPELALFFKAKHARPKDQQDFDLVAPLMAAADRHRLRSWLTLAHPGHRWLGALSG